MIVLFTILNLLAVVHAQLPSLALPPLLGPLTVGTKSLYLPAPKTQSPPRDIMISLFYPTSSNIDTKKYPIAAAYDPGYASFLESSIGLLPGLAGSLLTQAHLNAPLSVSKSRNPHQRDVNCPKDHPNIVLFSPGYGASRLDYTATLSNLASRGYIAIGVDHPNDTAFISYPNGRTLFHAPLDLDATTAVGVVDLRVQDLRFVLDSLAKKRGGVLPGLNSPLDVSRVAIFGHSIGGAAAASAVLADRRFVAGSNIDGSLWGPVVSRGVKNAPFMIVAAQVHNSSTASFADWNTFWKASKGGLELEVQVKGASHGSFSDQAVLYGVLRALGLVGDLDPTGEVFGSIGGRVLDVLDGYLTAFFDYVFTGKKGSLLKGPSALFPEVSFYPIGK